MLDSWEFFRAPGRTHTGLDYRNEGENIAAYFSSKKISGVLNYYADPSHIVNDDNFYATVKKWATIAENVDYRALLKELENAEA